MYASIGCTTLGHQQRTAKDRHLYHHMHVHVSIAGNRVPARAMAMVTCRFKQIQTHATTCSTLDSASQPSHNDQAKVHVFEGVHESARWPRMVRTGPPPPYQPQYATFQARNTMSPAPNRESEQTRAMLYQALQLTLVHCCLPSDFKGSWHLSGGRARAPGQLKQHNPEYLSSKLSV